MTSSVPRPGVLLLTVGLAAAFALVAVVVTVTLSPGDLPTEEPPPRAPSVAPDARDTGVRGDGPEPVHERDTAPAGETPRAPSRTKRLADELSSPDASKRLLAAREILREGVAGLHLARAVQPKTEEGRRLLADVELALDGLRINKKAAAYRGDPPEVAMQLELEACASVLPQELLKEQRRDYWAVKVENDTKRVAKGVLSETLLMLDELELAKARSELGEITGEELEAVFEPRLRRVESWVSGMSRRSDVPPDKLRRYVEQLDRLKKR